MDSQRPPLWAPRKIYKKVERPVSAQRRDYSPGLGTSERCTGPIVTAEDICSAATKTIAPPPSESRIKIPSRNIYPNFFSSIEPIGGLIESSPPYFQLLLNRRAIPDSQQHDPRLLRMSYRPKSRPCLVAEAHGDLDFPGPGAYVLPSFPEIRKRNIRSATPIGAVRPSRECHSPVPTVPGPGHYDVLYSEPRVHTPTLGTVQYQPSAASHERSVWMHGDICNDSFSVRERPNTLGPGTYENADQRNSELWKQNSFNCKLRREIQNSKKHQLV